MYRSGWLPDVHAVLQSLIDRHGQDGPEFDSGVPPFAVFDSDQTITRFNIGDAVLAYQVEQRAFALHHPPFWELLPRPLPEGRAPVSSRVTSSATSWSRRCR